VVLENTEAQVRAALGVVPEGRVVAETVSWFCHLAAPALEPGCPCRAGVVKIGERARELCQRTYDSDTL
jgi:hypothetical protein